MTIRETDNRDHKEVEEYLRDRIKVLEAEIKRLKEQIKKYAQCSN